jgi:hypothetical protein
MATLFEKLNLKDHQEILILNAPESFERELSRGLNQPARPKERSRPTPPPQKGPFFNPPFLVSDYGSVAYGLHLLTDQ